MKHLIFLALLAAAPMAQAQPAVDENAEFLLTEMDGAPYEGRSTMVFPAEGRVAGQGPCNRFMGRAEWGEDGAASFGPLASTMMACPDLDREKALLHALGEVTRIEMTDDGFVLTTAAGDALRYSRESAD
ncbi:META domain-containing protein [Mangrovicoccus algicola]|uniref:META domain-containing protein n=1 Tax=Mangrovicoccus algicola TaxID=2771008 RepID=A0A8J7CLA3_9RHOB|nr:META domain-containing protein [Mangrovicoccus algicola]MBE3639706.1 META domain-containing protein [Mangrovicoccus algicola]